jgi:hypothetical protein
MLILAVFSSILSAQSPYGPSPQQGYFRAWQMPPGANVPLRPTYRLAERSDPPSAASSTQQLQPGDPKEHPLMPVVRWGRAGLVNMERIADYSAVVAKRERIDGKVGEYEYMYTKIRHKPFSVYLNFVPPSASKGQEVIYIDGANDGKLWVHSTGITNAMIGTVSLKPDSMMAMRNQRYPITMLGIQNLTRRLVEVTDREAKLAECEVKYYRGAKVNDRVTTMIEIVHPVPRREFMSHLARIFVDDELNAPIRYEAYDWPRDGAPPELIEEYTYLNVKLNNGFTDAEFDIRNPNYHFH